MKSKTKQIRCFKSNKYKQREYSILGREFFSFSIITTDQAQST